MPYPIDSLTMSASADAAAIAASPPARMGNILRLPAFTLVLTLVGFRKAASPVSLHRVQKVFGRDVRYTNHYIHGLYVFVTRHQEIA